MTPDNRYVSGWHKYRALTHAATAVETPLPRQIKNMKNTVKATSSRFTINT